MTAASGADHSLRYRVVDSGTLYDCECGDFTEAADPTDEDHRRVYEAHAAHIRAASGADRDVCACGHDVTDHGTGPVGCIHRDGCSTFASGADQPTLRDQLADIAHRAVQEASWERGVAMLDTDVAAFRTRLLADLLPLIEADRERTKAEGGAEALEKAAEEVEAEAVYDDAAPDEQCGRGLFAVRLRALAKNLRFDASALRANPGGAAC